MILQHVGRLLANPKAGWRALREHPCTVGRCYAVHVLLLAAIPAVAGYIGTTQFGWRIGAGDPIRLTSESAALIALAYYFAMLVGVYSMGWMIHWMAGTYGAHPTLAQCVILAAYTATPLFLVGIAEIYPLLWLNLVLGLPALAWTVYLLYTGVPIMMDIPEERGFLFSTAVLAVGLVALVAMLALTAILWGFGIAPGFTD